MQGERKRRSASKQARVVAGDSAAAVGDRVGRFKAAQAIQGDPRRFDDWLQGSKRTARREGNSTTHSRRKRCPLGASQIQRIVACLPVILLPEPPPPPHTEALGLLAINTSRRAEPIVRPSVRLTRLFPSYVPRGGSHHQLRTDKCPRVRHLE